MKIFFSFLIIFVYFYHSLCAREILINTSAKIFQDNNAGLMIEEKNLKENIIEATILKLFKNLDDLKLMGFNASQLIIKNAREKIIEQIEILLKSK